MRTLAALALVLASTLAHAAPAPDGILKKGQRVAIVGDSITEQKLYSRYMELYLTACLPELELKVLQLGWSGERAPGFVGRMNNDLLPWKPDVVTTCYGMNDGEYRAYEESIGKRYGDAMAAVVARCKAAGATVVVGSPGAVDTKFFRNGGDAPRWYNDNLAHLRDIAKSLAEKEKMPFADVHGAMIAAMGPAKAALGESYDVCGKDGFHPGPNGHLLMAYAFLKAMGIDGQIGTITVDLKGAARASDGHRIVTGEGGKVEVESRRYPFCFSGDEKSSGGTRSITPFVAFNQDLNRLTLVVKNLDAAHAKVTWGSATKSFPRAEVEAGVNLAAAFPDNPFVEVVRALETKIAAKQSFETGMVKSLITQMPGLVRGFGQDPTVEASVEALRQQLFETHDKLHRSVRASLVPVKHLITVTPE